MKHSIVLRSLQRLRPQIAASFDIAIEEHYRGGDCAAQTQEKHERVDQHQPTAFAVEKINGRPSKVAVSKGTLI